MTSARIFGLEVHGGSAGEEIVRCPFHEDNTPSAWFNPKKNLFYCAVCNCGMTGEQVAKRLGYDSADMTLEYEPPEYSFVQGEEVIDYGMPFYSSYVMGRGIDHHTCDYYGIRVKVDEPEAIVIPITSVAGTRTGVAYRYVQPEIARTRYRFLGTMQPLWPMHMLMNDPGLPKVIVEGAFSAMKIHAMGRITGLYLSSFALLGAKANQKIVDTVRFMGDKVTFLYDNDIAGRRAKEKLQGLWPSVRAHCVGPSPDDMTVNQFEKLFRRLYA